MQGERREGRGGAGQGGPPAAFLEKRVVEFLGILKALRPPTPQSTWSTSTSCFSPPPHP